MIQCFGVKLSKMISVRGDLIRIDPQHVRLSGDIKDSLSGIFTSCICSIRSICKVVSGHRFLEQCKCTINTDRSLNENITLAYPQGRSQDLTGGGGGKNFFEIRKFVCREARGVRDKFFEMVQFGVYLDQILCRKSFRNYHFLLKIEYFRYTLDMKYFSSRIC